ncbi:protein shifted isoform X1 [Lucilia sericata]|uniref:protein shifted isoform X1 n=1 Tax=Lucilia sericata TaxID=13632 RepID=UPI0018A84472|nr:protein shifted isoform X1 [Lucilia sericata]
MLKSHNNCNNKKINRSHDHDLYTLQERPRRRRNVSMFRCKFIYLLLMLLYLANWIDGIEARQQQQKHDAQQQQQQINEVGAHHHQQQHHTRGNSGGSSSGSSYEVLGKRNKKNNQHHNNNNNNNNHNYNEKKHKSSNGHSLNYNSSSLTGGSKPHGAKGRKGESNKQRRAHHRKHNRSNDPDDNISLWITEQQLKVLTDLFFPQNSLHGPVYAIQNGHVLNHILDSRYYEYLIIPAEVNYVNFTWKSGHRKYFYHFDLLETMDESILKAPTVSIKPKGRIPNEEKNFSVFLPCSGNNSGTAMFNVGLTIHNRSGNPLPGTPLRLNFKKECAHRGVYDSLDASNPTLITSMQGPDPECHVKCGEHGFCNHRNICQCRSGYIGQYCEKAFCFPQCMNGGNCTAPSVCSCPDGYQGTQCEGGICAEKCLNGGKCVQKDKCECPRGYYGLRCEFSKCEISCMHGGRCIGTNLCRCAEGLSGDHCEIGHRQRYTCKRKCKHGDCMPNKTCKCKDGFYGRFCNRRVKKH